MRTHERDEMSDSEFRHLMKQGNPVKKTKWQCDTCKGLTISQNPFPKTCMVCGSAMSRLQED